MRENPRPVDQRKSQGSSWEAETTPTPTIMQKLKSKICKGAK